MLIIFALEPILPDANTDVLPLLAFSWITFPISVYSVFLYYPVFAVSWNIMQFDFKLNLRVFVF